MVAFDTERGRTMKGTMLGAYGAWAAARSGDAPGSLSFRRDEWKEVQAWKAAARGKLAELIMAPPGTVASDVVVHGAVELDGVSIEELSWQLPYGPRTGAYFLKPKGARGRLPAVLALHDHGGSKYFGKRKIVRLPGEQHPVLLRHQRDAYGGVGWANEIARRGFAVLVPDVFPFESRSIRASDVPAHVVERLMGAGRPQGYDVPRGEPEEAITAYNDFAAEHEHIVAKSLFSAGLTWPGLVTAEDRASLALLAARDDVDPARIACCGLSGGGIRTNFLAGLDDRIRCAVTVGMMTTWRDFLLQVSHTHTWMIYVPGLPPLLDFAEIIGLRAPLPTLVLSTTEDELFTRSETERAAGMLAAVYRKAGAPGAFRFSMYPGPHKFDPAMQAEAFNWIEHWLG
jgi:dienelactone hydrolase